MNGKVVADVAGAEQEDLGYHESSDISLVIIQVPLYVWQVYQCLKRIEYISLAPVSGGNFW